MHSGLSVALPETSAFNSGIGAYIPKRSASESWVLKQAPFWLEHPFTRQEADRVIDITTRDWLQSPVTPQQMC